MIELKPHYSLLFIDSRDTEVILAKYTGSFKLPSNICLLYTSDAADE